MRDIHLHEGEHHVGAVVGAAAPEPVVAEAACAYLLVAGRRTVDAVHRYGAVDARLRGLLVAGIVDGEGEGRVGSAYAVGTVDAGVAAVDVLLAAVVADGDAAAHRGDDPQQRGVVPLELLRATQRAVGVEGEVLWGAVERGAGVVRHCGVADDAINLSRRRGEGGSAAGCAASGTHIFVVDRHHGRVGRCGIAGANSLDAEVIDGSGGEAADGGLRGVGRQLLHGGEGGAVAALLHDDARHALALVELPCELHAGLALQGGHGVGWRIKKGALCCETVHVVLDVCVAAAKGVGVGIVLAGVETVGALPVVGHAVVVAVGGARTSGHGAYASHIVLVGDEAALGAQ